MLLRSHQPYHVVDMVLCGASGLRSAGGVVKKGGLILILSFCKRVKRVPYFFVFSAHVPGVGVRLCRCGHVTLALALV